MHLLRHAELMISAQGLVWLLTSAYLTTPGAMMDEIMMAIMTAVRGNKVQVP